MKVRICCKCQPERKLIFNKALRIKWCRSRVRAMRFSEGVELLNEEMRRVLTFLDGEASRREERATGRVQALDSEAAVGPTAAPTMPVTLEGVVEEGLQADTQRQAAIRQNLFTRFATQWQEVPTFIRLWNNMLAEPGV